jgi:hypothetical protein
MKTLRIITVILVAVVLVLPACDHTPPTMPECLTAVSEFKPDDCPGNGDCSFAFYPESKLEVKEAEQYVSFEIKSGENLVFHFEYIKHDNPLILDDEYVEDIYFEVKPAGNSFVISTEDLKKAGVLFGRGCFCADGGYHRINQGCIYGYKINDRTWNISLNLTATTEYSSYNRMKQRDFLKTQRPE